MSSQLHCLGCGDSLLVGAWKRLLDTSSFKHHWKELVDSILQEQNLQWDQNVDLMSKYICKKCQVAYEGYITRREKLRAGLRKAIEYMPVTTASDEVHGPSSLGKRTRTSQQNKGPNKRPCTSDHTSQSPDIQVIHIISEEV